MLSILQHGDNAGRTSKQSANCLTLRTDCLQSPTACLYALSLLLQQSSVSSMQFVSECVPAALVVKLQLLRRTPDMLDRFGHTGMLYGVQSCMANRARISNWLQILFTHTVHPLIGTLL